MRVSGSTPHSTSRNGSKRRRAGASRTARTGGSGERPSYRSPRAGSGGGARVSAGSLAAAPSWNHSATTSMQPERTPPSPKQSERAFQYRAAPVGGGPAPPRPGRSAELALEVVVGERAAAGG